MQSKRPRIFIAIALLAALFLSLCLPIAATTVDAPALSEASAVQFYHLESQRIMCEKNADSVLPAGSTVKLLAGLIACERLAGQLNDEVVITQEMLKGSTGYSQSRLTVNSRYSMQALLYLAICGSYNNAYDALAYLIGGGSQTAFVEMMNQKARELGAESTVVGDVTGVADNSLTTAADLLRIAQAALQAPLYMQISSSIAYDVTYLKADQSVGGYRINNRNALVSASSPDGQAYKNDLCQGLTAGSTPKAGASVITLAQKGNDRYLCVVLGAQETELDAANTEYYSYIVANRLIKWGYAHYSYVEILTPETEICRLPVTVSDLTEEISVVPATSFSAYLPANAELGRDITYSIRLMYEKLEAPVKAGTHVGYVAIVYQGEILASVALYTAGEAERSSFVSSLLRIQLLTQNRAVVAGAGCFLTLILGWIIVETVIRRRRRHKWDKYFSEKIDLPETILKKRK